MAGMTTKELATRWFTGIWNDRDPGVIHELMDPQCQGHTEGGTVFGPDAFEEQMYVPFIAAFPDMRLTLHQVIADGDDAVGRWTVIGTHTGPMGAIAPTGRKVQFSGMTWLRFRDGKLVEGADGWNAHALASLLTCGAEAASVKLCG
jgi:predicted ester cyclase